MPAPLITRKDIANGAVSRQPRNFSSFGGKSREARVFFYFRTANLPETMPHSLGRTPTGYTPGPLTRDGAPGVVYSPVKYDLAGASDKTDAIYNLGRNYIVLACTTDNTWCEVTVY